MTARHLAAALAVTLVALALASTAHAGSIDNVAPATDGLLLSAAAYATQVWADEGRSLPPVELMMYDDGAPGANESAMGALPAQGYGPESRVWVRRSYWASIRHQIARVGHHYMVNVLAGVCALLIHERGHNLGYQHTVGGIMDPAIPSVPGTCFAWAMRTRDQGISSHRRFAHRSLRRR